METKIQIDAVADSVRGCWLGKNIGGTLGAPFEGQQKLQDVTFYVQKNLNSNPEPNDDLDLQLAWLTLAEYYGIYRLTPRLLGEYWINAVIGPWNEYAVCRWNCQTGFYPPLSGSVDNDEWHWSNGAWIRSEIWACLFPGDPDGAIEFAWLDACCDHAGEGIYAEMFTAALESAAFVEKDLRKLIAVGLSKIPTDSRIARSVKLVCDSFDNGEDWISARNKVLEDSADLGWFQAPGNIGFMVIGLLYGRGDFARTICLAANCGDDTDCTAATAGAVMGILLGAEKIPEKWKKPIGDAILTKSLNHFNLPLPTPKTITELTNRVLRLRQGIAADYPRPRPERLDAWDTARRLLQKSPYELQFDISFAKIGVEYLEGPLMEPGKKCPVRIWIDPIASMPEFRFRWLLPDGWHSSRTQFSIAGQIYCRSSAETDLTPPESLADVMSYLTLEITADNRNFPTHVMVPLRLRNAVRHPRFQMDPESARLQEMFLHTQHE